MPRFFKVQVASYVSVHEIEGVQGDTPHEEEIVKLRGVNAPWMGDLGKISVERVNIDDIPDGTQIFGRREHFPAEHYKQKKGLWLVVGGKPHRDISTGTGTFTGLDHWGPFIDKGEAEQKAGEVYDECGGLVQVIQVM